MGGKRECICRMCLEEMDLTDRELQPCICGYEICLWCWHCIIQTATKAGGNAQCPSCHSPYDEEKILKRTISKERLEMVNVNKKHKLQKIKPRLPDVGKDLNSIRVIRRNIVYIAGIPKNLANETTLRKKDYLGQYGRIVKIFFAQTDVSRQHYSSDSCIVYATFSKKEEALRCIQAINGFILDGRPLKASFGTTRYCHSWLNNVPCKNPDCLYVHEVVSEEDICLREEVIPFCTGKLQQCPGLATSNLKQHSGSFLPPPLDSKNVPPPLDLINNHRHMQNDYFKRSYASVAASHNLSKISSMNDNLSSKHSSQVDICFPANSWEHIPGSREVPASGNEISHSKQDIDFVADAKYFVGFSCSEYSRSPNPVADVNTHRLSFQGDYISEGYIEEPFFLHSDSQFTSSSANALTVASADCFNPFSDISTQKCESVESISKEFSSKWDNLSAVSRKCESFSWVQTLPNDPTLQKADLSLYDLSRLHSDLGSEKLDCSLGDEEFFGIKSKDFSTLSTSLRNLHHKLDKPSANLATKPMQFDDEQKKKSDNSSSYGVHSFIYSNNVVAKDKKFLNESYREQCDDRILSDILALDLDAIVNLDDTQSVLGQLRSSDDMSRIPNNWLSSTSDVSKSYFSLTDDLLTPFGNLSPVSIDASCSAYNSSSYEIMLNKEEYIEDLTSKCDFEASKGSKILGMCGNLPVGAVCHSPSLLGMHHSGSYVAQDKSQHQYPNCTRRTMLLTPPGFPPKKPRQGASNAAAAQGHLPRKSLSNMTAAAMTTSVNMYTDTVDNDSTPYSADLEVSSGDDSHRAKPPSLPLFLPHMVSSSRKVINPVSSNSLNSFDLCSS